MKIKETERIRLTLKNFKQFDSSTDDYLKFVNILIKINYPPSYIVQLLLFAVLGFRNYGKMEKISWHTYLQYKNYKFMIHDYKFGTWSIESVENNEEIVKLAKEIHDKIIKASKLFDKLLYSDLKDKIKEGNFYLDNVYHKLAYIYEFYKEKVQDTIKKYSEPEKNKNVDISNIGEIWNTMLKVEREVSAYSFALILSFFSLVEFLMDAFYAFEQPPIDFFDFKKKYWKERFNLIVDLKKERELKQIYDKLVEIKEKYRNPLAHGLSNKNKEANLLIQFPYIGLIPLSYDYLFNEVRYGFTEINKNDACDISNTLESFFDILRNKAPYKFYMLYISYGFAVPMNKEKISKIKGIMTTYEEFKDYLDGRAFYEDMVTNRDI